MKAYKYLSVEESHNVEHKNEEAKLKEEYVRRLKLLLNTELSNKTKMQTIGSLLIPVLRYSFGIINCHQEEIKKNWTEKQGKCQPSTDSATQEQTLIVCMSPEKEEEEDRYRQKEPT